MLICCCEGQEGTDLSKNKIIAGVDDIVVGKNVTCALIYFTTCHIPREQQGNISLALLYGIYFTICDMR